MNDHKQLNEALEHFKKNLTSGDPLLETVWPKIEKASVDAGLSLGDNVRKTFEKLTSDERDALLNGLMKFPNLAELYAGKGPVYPLEAKDNQTDLGGPQDVEHAYVAIEKNKTVRGRLSVFHPKEIQDN